MIRRGVIVLVVTAGVATSGAVQAQERDERYAQPAGGVPSLVTAIRSRLGTPSSAPPAPTASRQPAQKPADADPGTAVRVPEPQQAALTPPASPDLPGSRNSACNGQRVTAAYYWQGTRTANGERFNPHGLTAAHRTLPFGTKLTVTNPRTGKSVEVRINDRGPFVRGVSIDLSLGAAKAIGMRGTGAVCML